MIKSFNHFKIFEDVNLSKKILNQKLEEYDKLRKTVKNNEGYLGKLTEFLIKKDIPFEELEKLYQDLIDMKSKNVKIQINDKSYEEIIDAIQDGKTDIKINSFIKELPSTQKKLLKNELKESNLGARNRIINSILKILERPDKKYFFEKISRYKTINELKNAIETFSISFDNEKENIINTVKDLKSRIVYDENNILIILIHSYEDLKELAKDTLWCTVQSPALYRGYNKEGAKQFILLDYNSPKIDPKFKIGFNFTTIISHAFDTLDKNSKSYISDLFAKYKIDMNEIIGEELKEKKGDLSKIKLSSKTSKSDWFAVSNVLNQKQLIDSINKIIGYRKSKRFKIDVLKRLVERLEIYKKGYITKKELSDINEDLPEFYQHYINTSSISSFASIDKLKRPLYDKVFSDEVLVKYFNPSILPFKDNRSGLHNIDKDFYEFLFDYFQDIYDKNIKVDDKLMGVKLTANFERTLLILSKALNKEPQGDFKKNYNEIIKNENVIQQIRLNYQKLFDDLELDLEKDFVLKKIENIDIDRIIKKDYTDFKYSFRAPHIFRDQKIINTLEKILKHLDGYKLNFKMDKDFIRRIKNYDGEIENDKLKEVKEFFDNLRVLYKNKVHQFGDLKIKVIE